MLNVPKPIEGIGLASPDLLASQGMDLFTNTIVTFGPAALGIGAVIYGARKCMEGLGILDTKKKN